MMQTKIEREIRPQIQTLQVIIGNFLLGPTLFGMVAIYLAGAPDFSEPGGVLTKIALIGGLVALVLSPVIEGFLRTQSFRSAEMIEKVEERPAAMMSSYLVTRIVSVALLEGSAFLALVAYLMEKGGISLAMAGLLLAAIALKFPFAGSVARKIERELRDRGWLE